MRIVQYIKSYAVWFVMIWFFYITWMGMLTAFRTNLSLCIACSILFVLVCLVCVVWDYRRRNRFYGVMLERLEQLQDKYMISEMLPDAGFYEGDLLADVLYACNKSMRERVNAYAKESQEFQEYIEMWVHEVKIPIASLTLMGLGGGDVSERRWISQVRRLDADVDQVLYYVRAEHAEKDYHIRKTLLAEVVHDVAMHNKDDLLYGQVDFTVDNLQHAVMTDAKWLTFILNQIVNNAIKYRKPDADDAWIVVSEEEQGDCIVLHVRDNGIGIPEEDLPRVFEQSFTGSNGMYTSKSTGMGLYIAKSLCGKLGHTISVQSEQGRGCDVAIGFGRDSFYDM